MLAVISPAKTLDYKRPLPPLDPTQPRFAEEAEALAAAAARLSKPKLAGLMHISEPLAALNVERYRGFAEQPTRPALYAFAGDVYAGFEVHSVDDQAVRFAQDHLRILSGLYGLLRPLDAIRPYRLEMGTRWAPGRSRNLYDYWQGRIADRLAADLAETGGDTVINLASKEYWQAVDGKLPASVRVIEIDFREEGPNGLRFNTFAAKRARGMMARYICEHGLVDPDQVKGFDSDGYAYDAANSDDTRWRFHRG
ncbi:peroxide stress protein YaaA [Sphingosinicella sp. BN140058]|uniref:peroxide stress protein YaaA n=1 Tax=Sphingosinicella sp. BN140058 TaxID=1892855 RepID=UPI00101246D9|nr:peroxide stress protein YaaA [Sphingosinicella sp. BN140058]QAY79280.1 peroxide stress protein YaaA [Sphingosinicella sp. BN140058]